jgi:VanZ family protein
MRPGCMNKSPTELDVRRGFVNSLVFVFYAVLVAFVSLRPMSGATIEPWDKVLHLVIYAVFAVLGYQALKEGRRYFYVCLGIIAYSALIEVGQSYMPGRVMSGYDFLANTVGVVFGAVVVRRVRSDVR